MYSDHGFYQRVLSRDVDNTVPDDVHFNPVEPKINGRHKPNYTEQITWGNSCTCLLMLHLGNNSKETPASFKQIKKLVALSPTFNAP